MAWYTNCWAGLAFETGGEIIIGMSQQSGLLISIGDLVDSPQRVRWMTFQQKAVTIGLGLGGAGGGNFVIGANAVTPQDFDGAPPGSIDFSLDMGQAGLGRYLRSAPEMIEMEAVARMFDGRLMALADGLQKYEKNAYKVKDAAEGLLKNGAALFDCAKKEVALISLPLPGSLGLRASIKMKFETTDVMSWGSMSLII